MIRKPISGTTVSLKLESIKPWYILAQGPSVDCGPNILTNELSGPSICCHAQASTAIVTANGTAMRNPVTKFVRKKCRTAPNPR